MNGERLLTLFACLALATPAVAQIPYDSLPADSAIQQPDTVNETELFLKAQAANLVRLPVLPLIGTEGPLPPMSRIVFTRDSIEWTNAETLSDLLQKAPGVYLWRGGWIGRPAPPNLRGRGPTSVEYLVDGLPFIPMGPDSLGVDPTIFALSMYDRVEIERWPEDFESSCSPGGMTGIPLAVESAFRRVPTISPATSAPSNGATRTASASESRPNAPTLPRRRAPPVISI